MNIIKSGNTYSLYNNSIEMFNSLPPATYKITFDQMKGFEIRDNFPIEIKEKIYGVHSQKVNKVLNAFNNMDRNLGVILSGDKGIGKSLFAKLLCIEAINNNFPVIICNNYISGIADFINQINQECVILFDEYDKTFGKRDSAEMLSLFDGITTGKKLFIITCNELEGLSDYLLNRPGRFHYHFRFDYPNYTQIKEYLMDKIPEQYYDQINEVISFSQRVPLNYDCLRAIAFELKCGLKFKEAILDLNIINTNNQFQNFHITIHTKDNVELVAEGHFNSFSNQIITLDCGLPNKDGYGRLYMLQFNPIHIKWDSNLNTNIIPPNKINIFVNNYQGENEERPKLAKKILESGISYISINCNEKKDNIHFFTDTNK